MRRPCGGITPRMFSPLSNGGTVCVGGVGARLGKVDLPISIQAGVGRSAADAAVDRRVLTGRGGVGGGLMTCARRASGRWIGIQEMAVGGGTKGRRSFGGGAGGSVTIAVLNGCPAGRYSSRTGSMCSSPGPYTPHLFFLLFLLFGVLLPFHFISASEGGFTLSQARALRT